MNAASLHPIHGVHSWIQGLWTYCRMFARSSRVIALALVLPATSQAQTDQPSAPAVVRKVVGTCESRIPLTEEWFPVKEGHELRPGQVLRCAIASWLVFTYSPRGLSRRIDGSSPASATYTIPYVPLQPAEPREHLGGRIAAAELEGQVRMSSVRLEMTLESEVRAWPKSGAVASTRTLRITAVTLCAANAAETGVRHSFAGAQGMVATVDRPAGATPSVRFCDAALDTEQVAKRVSELANLLSTLSNVK